jgi:putative FmdB family regulatory protein
MPIYEYRCSSCGHEKDVLQKMSDPPLVDCPECGKPTMTKQVTAAGFQLKGSGWYATDFKGGVKSAAKSEKSEGDAGKPDAKTDKADGKSDKSDAKSEKSDSKTESKPKPAASAGATPV